MTRFLAKRRFPDSRYSLDRGCLPISKHLFKIGRLWRFSIREGCSYWKDGTKRTCLTLGLGHQLIDVG